MEKNSGGWGNYLLPIVAACLLYALSGGIRAVYGIMIRPLTVLSGISYADAAFALALPSCCTA